MLIDAEETWIIEPVNELTERMMEQFNNEKVYIFNTYQLYCHGTLPYLKESAAKAKEKGYILGAKLVRGAYMEKERARAAEKGYTDPIQPDKKSTDRDYDEAVIFCLENSINCQPLIQMCTFPSCMVWATISLLTLQMMAIMFPNTCHMDRYWMLCPI